MSWLRAAVAFLVAGAAGAAVVSGGSSTGPQTPRALPGLPAPFLGTAVVGDGGLTAAIDAYGAVVDLRAGPAGWALIDNPAERQAAGTVSADTGIVPRVRIGGGPALPFWQADWVRQRYLPGTNVVRTVARFGRARVRIVDAVAGDELVRAISAGPAGTAATPSFEVDAADELECRQRRGTGRAVLACAIGGRRSDAVASADADADAGRIAAGAITGDRRWLDRAQPLGAAAPAWTVGLYRRSLLVLRALTDRRSGAVAAGARDGWAYVWPRDAGAVALAFAAAGYRSEVRRIARFLLSLDLSAAARFHGDGTPVPGRPAQGDAAGWTTVAVHAAGLGADGPKTLLYGGKSTHRRGSSWRDRADYWESDPGNYLGNALAAEPLADGPKASKWRTFQAHRPEGGLVRRAGDPGSGLDSAAAWAVRPFSQPGLYPAARRTLLRLAAGGTRFGITPGEGWDGVDPWSAPTAWTAWGLAALADHSSRRGSRSVARRDRHAALRLLTALRRSATPAGVLPERVDVRTGLPRSTTPLAWSHAFAILALRQLWP